MVSGSSFTRVDLTLTVISYVILFLVILIKPNGILGTARVKMTGKPAVLEARREDE